MNRHKSPSAPAWPRHLPRLAAGLGVGVTLLLVVTLAGCGAGQDPVSGRDFRDLPADQIMFGAHYDIKEMGTLRARLHADTSYLWEDSAKTLMVPVDLTLFNENGGQTAHLTAREGELDTPTNKMIARGNVVLVTTAGNRRILTEELHYDPHTGRIWSNVHTVVLDGETRLEGEGFSADESMKNIEVFKGIGENIRIEF